MQRAAVFVRAIELSGRIDDSLQKRRYTLFRFSCSRTQSIDGAQNVVDGSRAQAGQELTDVGGQGSEKRFNHLWISGEARSQCFILRSDANRAGVEMALSRHDAANGQQGRRSEAEFFGAQ